MKKRFSEEQIIGFLREADKGVAVKELCRKHGFSEASYHMWLEEMHVRRRRRKNIPVADRQPLIRPGLIHEVSQESAPWRGGDLTPRQSALELHRTCAHSRIRSTLYLAKIGGHSAHESA